MQMKFRIGIRLGMMGGGGVYCGPGVHAAPDKPAPPGTWAAVTVPIALKPAGAQLQGQFDMDYFLPGRCRWGFDSLDAVSPFKGSVTRFSEYATQYNFDTSHSHGAYDQSPDQQRDIWCAPDPSPNKGEHGKMACASLNYFLAYRGMVSNDLLTTIPLEERNRNPRMNMFPFTKSVTLRYHDLGAENEAAMRSGSFAASSANVACPASAVRILAGGEQWVEVNGDKVTLADLVPRLLALKPTPTSACFANTTPPDGSPFAAITAVSGMPDWPITLYTDGTFRWPMGTQH